MLIATLLLHGTRGVGSQSLPGRVVAITSQRTVVLDGLLESWKLDVACLRLFALRGHTGQHLNSPQRFLDFIVFLHGISMAFRLRRSTLASTGTKMHVEQITAYLAIS